MRSRRSNPGISLFLNIFENMDCDIYLTGSNSILFSSNLSTLLSGRAVTIEMFPFSYEEFLLYTNEEDSDSSILEYMAYEGFPLALMVAISVPMTRTSRVLDGLDSYTLGKTMINSEVFPDTSETSYIL